MTHFFFTYDDEEIYYTQANAQIHKISITNLSNIEIATKNEKITKIFFNSDSEKVIYINSKNDLVMTELQNE